MAHLPGGNNPNLGLEPSSPYYWTKEHFEAYHYWYEKDRDVALTARTFQKTESTIKNWIKKLEWHARADAMDARLMKQVEEKLLTRKQKALSLHEALGSTMTNRALEFYANNKILRAQDAAAAARVGTQIQREALGLPTHLLDIMNKSDDDLIREYDELTERLGSEQEEYESRAALGTGEEGDGDEELIL